MTTDELIHALQRADPSGQATVFVYDMDGALYQIGSDHFARATVARGRDEFTYHIAEDGEVGVFLFDGVIL